MKLQGVLTSIQYPRKTHLLVIASAIIIVLAGVGAIRSLSFDPGEGALTFEEIYANRGPEYTRDYLEKYLKINPADYDAWKMLAIVYGESLSDKTGRESLPDRVTPQGEAVGNGEKFLSSLREANTDFEHLVISWYLAYRYGTDEAIRYLKESGRAEGEEAIVELSDMFYREGRIPEALQLLERSVNMHPESASIKIKLIDLALELDLRSDLIKMMDQDSYRSLCDNYCEYRLAVIRGDYLNAILPMARMQAADYDRTMALAAALLAGFLWFLLWYSMGRMGDWPIRKKMLGILAVLLGIISTYPTVLFVSLEKEVLTYDPEAGDILRNLLFYIVTVGLREEFIKLLFFAPVALVIRKERNAMMALVLASLTGLGFALEENISYFHESGGAAIGSRFLTANFFHMVLTGYTGYHLILAFDKGGDAWSDLMAAFVKMVFAHGLYDFLLSEGSIEGLSFLAMTVYIWLAREYLMLMFSHDSRSRRKVSLTLVYTLVMASIVGMNFFISFYYYGIVDGLSLSLAGVLEMMLISFMFYHEFDESLKW